MKTSYELLKKYIPLEIPVSEISHQLTMKGLEVEETIEYANPFEKMVVGQILEKRSHPNADKLSICKVDIQTSILSIVCGATNFKEKDKVCVALIGATLPNGLTMTHSNIRGEDSQGMLCSTKELGLYESFGIWILPENATLGSTINSFLPQRDFIFNLALTANRGDALSTLGIAREVAIIEKKALSLPITPNIPINSSIEKPKISIHSQECPRYMARIVKGITVKESPSWLKIALYKYGLNSINNVVDASNFIMMELGHPTHAFDLKKLSSSSLSIENLGQETSFLALNKEKLILPSKALVVKDEKNIVALAGIIGGIDSCITEESKDILLEAACFDAVSLRLSSQALNLSTDASYRFVRDIDIDYIPHILDALTHLILDIAGGEAGCVVDVYPLKKEKTQIDISASFIAEKLGFIIEDKQLESIFHLLNFTFTLENSQYHLSIPFYRNDITIPEDIVEEIIRVYGYENLPTTLPHIALSLENFARPHSFRDSIKNFLAVKGLSEMIQFSFLKESYNEELSLLSFIKGKSISIQNPLNIDFTTLRASLLASSFDIILKNFSQGHKNFHHFELGNIHYKNEKNEPQERTHLLCLLSGQKAPISFADKGKAVSFYDLKEIGENIFEFLGVSSEIEYKKETEISFLHPGKCASIFYQEKFMGFIGEMNPSLSSKHKIKIPLFIMEFDITNLLPQSTEQTNASFKPLSKYPSITRDLSFVAENEVEAMSLVTGIKSVSALITHISILDVYQDEKLGNNKKSITISLSFQSDNKTLTDEEINEIIKNIVSLIEDNWDVKLREE